MLSVYVRSSQTFHYVLQHINMAKLESKHFHVQSLNLSNTHSIYKVFVLVAKDMFSLCSIYTKPFECFVFLCTLFCSDILFADHLTCVCACLVFALFYYYYFNNYTNLHLHSSHLMFSYWHYQEDIQMLVLYRPVRVHLEYLVIHNLENKIIYQSVISLIILNLM